MRIWAGYSTVADRETGKVKEQDFFKCCHCSRNEFVEPFQTEFTRCWNCDDGMGGGLICKGCIGKPCVHFKKALEISESRDRLRRLIDQNADYT